jgi:hypothetical protein
LLPATTVLSISLALLPPQTLTQRQHTLLLQFGLLDNTHQGEKGKKRRRCVRTAGSCSDGFLLQPLLLP